MTDRNLAQVDAPKQSAVPSAPLKIALRHKLARRWRACRCWARYSLIGRHRGVPGLIDLVVADHPFGAMQVRSELLGLGELLAKLHPEQALEIGTAGGGTLLFLTRLASPRAKIVSMDLQDGGHFGPSYAPRRKWFYEHFARGQQRIKLLLGDSHSAEMLEAVKAEFPSGALDYLFIDGDHRYEGVKKDFEMYGPMVRKGGLIAFHDIVEGSSEFVGGVPRFWREVRSQYRHAEFIHDPLQGGFGIGVLYVD